MNRDSVLSGQVSGATVETKSKKNYDISQAELSRWVLPDLDRGQMKNICRGARLDID